MVGKNDNFLAKAGKFSILPTLLDIFFYLRQHFVCIFYIFDISKYFLYVCFVLADDRGLSPGQIAAIVVGSIAFILTVLVLGYLIRSGYLRRYFYKVENNTSLGFDNALFHKGVETQSESVNFD